MADWLEKKGKGKVCFERMENHNDHNRRKLWMFLTSLGLQNKLFLNVFSWKLQAVFISCWEQYLWAWWRRRFCDKLTLRILAQSYKALLREACFRSSFAMRILIALNPLMSLHCPLTYLTARNFELLRILRGSQRFWFHYSGEDPP